jgi:hypothetical protein
MERGRFNDTADSARNSGSDRPRPQSKLSDGDVSRHVLAVVSA